MLSDSAARTIQLLALNGGYWLFIGMMAFYVTPWALVLIFFMSGFSSNDRAEVEHDGTKVTVSVKSGTLTESDIRQAVQEVNNERRT